MGFSDLGLWKDQELKIHTCIDGALEKLRAEVKIDENAIEDFISGKLHRYLLNEKKRLKLRAVQIVRQFAIYEEVDSAKPIGYPDIAYCWDDFDSNQIEYHVECKRLKFKDGLFSSNYVNKGISRYQKSFYSNGHPSGTMIGYIQKGSEVELLDEVNSFIPDPVSSLSLEYNSAERGISKYKQNFKTSTLFQLSHFWVNLSQ
ncbi:hypothetical protein [Priestia megaterium]|uniref:hypothetical protein n=1 Tax=Priestia megaterium TaxID=1404 RepID=UPI0022B92E02|nr:hypothetical protein [Priestia megaterium]MCZ8494033.1 hypothetical protein [Priestia megaterium]